MFTKGKVDIEENENSDRRKSSVVSRWTSKAGTGGDNHGSVGDRPD